MSSSFDFVRPFAYVFQDPRWLGKILIGGLFQLASIFLIGIFFVMGYWARLARNVIEGAPHPLPEWDDLGDYFVEGVKLFVIMLIYAIPLFLLGIAIFVPAGLFSAIASGRESEVQNLFSGGVMTCGTCLFVPISLALAFYLPAALLFAVAENRFGAAFEVGRIFRFIGDNAANYVIAFVVYLIARFAAPLGLILFCIGVVFTGFWAMLVSTYAFADVYRLSRSR